MNFNEYQVEGAKTAKQHTSLDIHAAGLSDFALGLTGEAGEVADLVKHQVFHKEHIELVEYVTEFITEYDCIECYKPFYVEDVIDKDDIIIRENRYSN